MLLEDKKFRPFVKRPCVNCPFVPNAFPSLGHGRADQIAQSLLKGDSFTCHKTTYNAAPTVKACAGAIAVLLKENRPNTLMQLSERLLGLNLSDEVKGA